MPDQPSQMISAGEVFKLHTMSTGELFKLYEDGKQRRYGLLFAINGGGFAIAKFIAPDCSGHTTVLGALRLWNLSAVMIVMTVLMVWDIFNFGTQMSEKLHGDVFKKPGRWVLGLLGGLILVGWVLVAIPARQ